MLLCISRRVNWDGGSPFFPVTVDSLTRTRMGNLLRYLNYRKYFMSFSPSRGTENKLELLSKDSNNRILS